MLQEKHSVIQEGGSNSSAFGSKSCEKTKRISGISMNLLTPKVGGSYILEQTVMTMILSLVYRNIPRKGENLFAGVSFGGNIAWVLYRRSVQEAHAFASAIGALDDAGQVPSVTQSMAEDMGVLVKIGSLLLLVPNSSLTPSPTHVPKVKP